MNSLKEKMTELARLMDEFGLVEARLEGDDWSIEFSKLGPQPEGPVVVASGAMSASPLTVASPSAPIPKPAAPPAAPQGTPISSPMPGIYYSAPGPGQDPFVKVGDTVQAGQVIGLIEAMKVYNEITATLSGTVTKIVAENGSVLNPGDPILFIG
ncbi:MAG TPA: acetyl-CoA carboxylase biotin carboxyl carrier protein subunit [Fimbriimonadaceae bacterium]|nr:acetyl-CoA carboxylase biotin carboxyl carrier protein subunit [Fimbriimonadaceae bacterium]HRJ32084.1 acetyl-CoA carboxylase biotin carboxyl carrier protein subunit [Fimbriimonadaceae bacterium]